MRTRTTIFVSFIGVGWHVREEGRKTLKTVIGWNKAEAISWARAHCRAREAQGERLELKIRNMLGQIKESDTYGDDPRPPKGSRG